MTIKQGQDINQKFVDLNNDIKTLKDSLSKKNSEIIVLNSDKKDLNGVIDVVNIKSKGLEEENVFLKQTIKKNEKYLQSERQKWAGWMFFSFFVTVMLGSLK